MNRDFKGVWIPKCIWENKNLSWAEKLLFLEIDSLAKNEECFASNEHFSVFLGVSTRQIQNYLGALKNKGLIKIQLFYKGNTKIVTKRIIIPIHKFADEENFVHTGEESFVQMSEESFVHTGEENFVDSNTLVNNTNNNTKDIKKINKKSASKTEYESEFETLWVIYPKKVSKQKARIAYIKARKEKKYTFEIIKNGLERYIDYLEVSGRTDSEYILNGSTFFNQERFLDEYNVVGLKKKPRTMADYLAEKHRSEECEPSRGRKIITDDGEILSESFQGF